MYQAYMTPLGLRIITSRIIPEAESQQMRKVALAHPIKGCALKSVSVLEQIKPDATVDYIGAHIRRSCVGSEDLFLQAQQVVHSPLHVVFCSLAVV
jgi:hypothetical protein